MKSCFLRQVRLILIAMILFLLSGCNGIVRYKTLGFRESATVNLYQNSSSYWRLLTVPAGCVVDAGIFVADVAANPFCALWMVSQGPDPGASFQPIAIIFMPIYWLFTPVAMVALPFGEQDYYQSTYGREGSWLKVRKDDETSQLVPIDQCQSFK